ncbi:hypothetical protein Bpfe_014589 [Biomphalaria pfeifferi]|uniref:Uncharacterized protein n=1 Tax=Biomphalaria pfeifferi TaxID=112525 RepID=A0AAD8BLT1_BIOPF|nr:hypothetical protein Bpfe_014589 [Biomphalaria pfeifferi]
MAGIDRDAERKKEMSNKKEQDIKKRKERSDREVAALLEKETCELSCESSTPEQSDEEYNHVGPRKKKVCQQNHRVQTSLQRMLQLHWTTRKCLTEKRCTYWPQQLMLLDTMCNSYL